MLEVEDDEEKMCGWWKRALRASQDAEERGELRLAREMCERLLSVPGLPSRAREAVRRSQVAVAPALGELAPSFTRQPISIPVEAGWSCFNPSIAAQPGGEGFALVARSSNYAVGRRLQYTTVDGDPLTRTVNSLVWLDRELGIEAVERIDESAVRAEPPLFPVTGFEDARIVHHAGEWQLACTVRDRNAEGIAQIALLRLCGARVSEMHLLSTGREQHEKNWMPVAGASGRLPLIYRVSPTIVVEVDEATGRAVPVAAGEGPPIAREFRGGSQALPCDGGHLCLVHEAIPLDEGGRGYLHRWVWFDAEWRLERLSLPFFFNERGIEFAAGLARRGEELIVSYGVGDREAWLATVAVEEVRTLLEVPLEPERSGAEMRAAAASEKKRGKKGKEQGRGESARTRERGRVGAPPGGTQVGDEDATGGTTIVATTLCGNSRKTIGGALRSVVDWVDWCLVIDTGISDETLAIAREIAGEKLIVREFPWRNDFAAARNYALAAAGEIGADWAITLDTDERLRVEGDPRPALAASEATVLHVRQVDGTYGKERVFRLPAAGSFVGPTHEAFVRSSGAAETLEGVWFDEKTKSGKAYRRKAERDVAILERYTAEHPREPRWFYYLGDSYAGLERYEEAVAAFRACYALNGWEEESAWAAYRAAETLLKLGRGAEALEACAIGMTRHAGLAELPWLAALANYRMDRHAQAVYWARLSATLGNFIGSGATVQRISFRHPPAQWEGPFDVLRFALRELRDDAGADEARRLYKAAKRARKDAGEG